MLAARDPDVQDAILELVISDTHESSRAPADPLPLAASESGKPSDLGSQNHVARAPLSGDADLTFMPSAR